jgi:hypothetical protein
MQRLQESSASAAAALGACQLAALRDLAQQWWLFMLTHPIRLSFCFFSGVASDLDAFRTTSEQELAALKQQVQR